jgi:uncharacterized membrane protein
MATLNNPISATDLTEFLADILYMVVVFMIPFVVFFIIYAGFLYTTARGNPEQIKKASSALLWAVVGGTIIIAGASIATIIKNVVGAF